MGRARSLAVLLAVPSALAHSTFMKYIPNGNNVHDQFGKAWVAVGHTAASPDDVPNFASDGFARNPFGWAFAKAGFVWTRELCEQDSDADGLTNGEELGDPLCVWEYGDAPSRTVNITHPGMTNADMLNASVRAEIALAKAAAAAASGLPTDAGITDGMPFRTYSSVWLPYVALPFFAWLAFGLKRFCAEDYLPRIRWLLLVWLGQCTGVGVSLGYHRYFSHKAFGANFWGKSLVGIMGSLSLQGNLYSWAYMHRIHHRLCDKELDFHSPIASDRGFVFAHATWYVTPKPHVRRGGDYYEHVIKDLLDDRDLWFVGWLTPERTILLMLVSCFLAACVACRHDDAKRRRCRLPAVTFMYFGLYAAIPVLIGWHDTMLVNSATHIFGVSPNRDGMGSDECMSRNVAWLQPFLNGENWHNNHHGAQHASAAGARARVNMGCGGGSIHRALDSSLPCSPSIRPLPHPPPRARRVGAPSSSSNWVHWYQLDTNYMLIRFFEFLGFFHDVRVELPVLREGYDGSIGADGIAHDEEILKMFVSTGCFGLMIVWFFFDRPNVFRAAAKARRGMLRKLPVVTTDTYSVQTASATEDGCEKESPGADAKAPWSVDDAKRAVKSTWSALSIRALWHSLRNRRAPTNSV